MPKPKLILLYLCGGVLFLTPCSAEKLVSPPQKIYHDGRILTYNPAWQDKEIYIEADLDGDNDREIIIGFVATYKPVKDTLKEDENRSLAIAVPAQKKEITLVSNYAFYQIYDKKPSGYYELAKTISGMDQLGRIDVGELDKKDPPLLFVLSPGGEHYLDLCVYRWKNGGYQLLFNKGSSHGIELNLKEKLFRVRTARVDEGGKTIWDVFVWIPEKNDFRNQETE